MSNPVSHQQSDVTVRWDRTEKALFAGTLIIGALAATIIGMLVFDILCHASAWGCNPDMFSKLGSVGQFFSENCKYIIPGTIGAVFVGACLALYLYHRHSKKKEWGKKFQRKEDLKVVDENNSNTYTTRWDREKHYGVVASKTEIETPKTEVIKYKQKRSYEVFSNSSAFDKARHALAQKGYAFDKTTSTDEDAEFFKPIINTHWNKREKTALIVSLTTGIVGLLAIATAGFAFLCLNHMLGLDPSIVKSFSDQAMPILTAGCIDLAISAIAGAYLFYRIRKLNNFAKKLYEETHEKYKSEWNTKQKVMHFKSGSYEHREYGWVVRKNKVNIVYDIFSNRKTALVYKGLLKGKHEIIDANYSWLDQPS